VFTGKFTNGYIENQKNVDAIAPNGHMYEMFGDCGLRNCLPLQKLIRGRMLQVTTKSPNILYMMLPLGWYFFPKSKVLGNCFIGSTFITRFKQGSFQEIQNTLL
jgi:hypothetical protein